MKPLNEYAGDVFMEAVRRMAHIPFWVSAGTCLGLYRDGDFVPGDTDLDIALIHTEGVDEEIQEMFRDWRYFDYAYKGDKPMQLAFEYKDVVLDIYFHHPEGENYVNIQPWGKTVMPKHFYDEVEWRDTKYGRLPFPSPVEGYLEIRYGDDWNVPQEKKPIYEVSE